MFPAECAPTRRSFLKSAAAMTAGFSAFSLAAPPAYSEDADLHIVGPRKGYSPQIGTLVSMMVFMRSQVLASVKEMTRKDLDFLLDDKANTIGALLYHIAAADRIFHINSFQNNPFNQLPKDFQDQFGVALALGEPARKTIKGHDLDFYVNLLGETREKTFAEFRKRDDAWLAAVDKDFPWGPTNNHCKWFHVCEHESNHNGQIKLVKGRLPGAKAPSE
jgi:uncharacterized protein DUF664